jgi:hypothetical protein
MSTKQLTHNDANDACEYNERIHMLMCELIARIDSLVQRDHDNVSYVGLIAIRNALNDFVNDVINKH